MFSINQYTILYLTTFKTTGYLSIPESRSRDGNFNKWPSYYFFLNVSNSDFGWLGENQAIERMLQENDYFGDSGLRNSSYFITLTMYLSKSFIMFNSNWMSVFIEWFPCTKQWTRCYRTVFTWRIFIWTDPILSLLRTIRFHWGWLLTSTFCRR